MSSLLLHPGGKWESGKAATCFLLWSNEAAGAKSCYNLICLASYIRDACVNIRSEGWMSLELITAVFSKNK